MYSSSGGVSLLFGQKFPQNCVKKYTNQRGLAAVLAVKKSADVCDTKGKSEESIACRWQSMKWGIHTGLKIIGRHHQKSKTGMLGAHKNELYITR